MSLPMRWNIQKKLMVTVLAGGGLFLAAGLYLTYAITKEALTVAIGTNFSEIAKKTSERFDATVEKEFRAFQLLSYDPGFALALMNKDRATLEQRLNPYLAHEEEKGEHLALYILDSQGTIIEGARFRQGEPIYQGDLPWWKVVSGENRMSSDSSAPGQLYAGTIYHDPATGRFAFDFAVPVMDPSGRRFVGAIKGVLDTEIFFRFIKKMSFAGTGHGMLMSSDGTPLVCSILPLIEHSMNKPLTREIVQKKEGWTLAIDDAHGGKNSIVGFAPVRFLNSLGPGSLGGNQWYAFIRQDPRETFAPVRSLLWQILLFEGIIIGLGGIFGMMIVRKFVLTPLGILQEGAQRVEKGDLEHHVDIQTNDEIEDLANGFNRMSRALKSSYAELEQKVKERTRELKASETKYRALMEQAYDAIFLMDPESGNFVEVNQQAEKMTGYSRGELLSRNFRDIQPEHEAEFAMEQFRKAVRKGYAAIHDTSLLRKDGDILWVDIRSRLIGYDGVKIYHCVIRDMTEQKRGEEKMRTASEQLSRSTQVMLEQDQELTSLRKEIMKLIRNSSLTEAEKDQALKSLKLP